MAKLTKTFWRLLRDQVGAVATVFGSIPMAMAGQIEIDKAVIPKIRTRIEFAETTEEALRQDFIRVGLDLRSAVAKYKKQHEQSI